MKWVKDNTGRFSQRPYYDRDELDFECERLVASFLLGKNGQVRYPICTGDVATLVEQEVADLDLGTDLSGEGDHVDGLTDFYRNTKPKVRISSALLVPSMENRLRTTLTHELGHVKLHSFLWSFGQLPLLGEGACTYSPRCKRDHILAANKVDWMEWQSGYACGAYLMPISQLRQRTARFLQAAGWEGQIPLSSPLAGKLIGKVMLAFQVSEEAARVRLLRCEILTEEVQPKRLI